MYFMFAINVHWNILIRPTKAEHFFFIYNEIALMGYKSLIYLSFLTNVNYSFPVENVPAKMCNKSAHYLQKKVLIGH